VYPTAPFANGYVSPGIHKTVDTGRREPLVLSLPEDIKHMDAKGDFDIALNSATYSSAACDVINGS
jgi:hypothetical protein